MSTMLVGTPKAFRAQQKYLPILATLGLLVVMFAVGTYRYTGFLSGQVVLNLFIDNASLIVVAVGMTFVILTGGIDLSVGSMIALSTMISAALVQGQGWPPFLVIPLVLAVGAAFGFAMGCIIHYFEIQPFIVTLAGMFLARGVCYTISIEAISVSDPVFTWMAQTRIPMPGGSFASISAVVALIVVAVAFYVLHFLSLGRSVYAIGGNQQSAALMGLPVARTRITVYAISGFCSALAGVIFTLYTLSGYGLHAVGMELDAIAAVVIGGTLLTGGYGFVAGALLGSLVLGLIQTIITFQGTLSSWWTRIVVGGLVFLFILLQKLIGVRKA